MNDTIAAISTPQGVGAIGILRISGPDAFNIALELTALTPDQFQPYHLKLTHIIDPQSANRVDQVLISYMPAPRSYTGEDTVEINAHGGPVLINKILQLILSSGARLAQPGEFTKRAFLNGKMDLTQAEAVMDMISARSQESASIALSQLDGRLSRRILQIRVELLAVLSHIEALIDFPDDMEDAATHNAPAIRSAMTQVDLLIKHAHEGQLYREGVTTAIVGLPNVGKSSLLNYLLGHERAIVSDIPGTTRDTIEEVCNIGGIAFKMIDTAGIRDVNHTVEQEGIRRSLQKIEQAQVVLMLVDANHGDLAQEQAILSRIVELNKKYLLVANKLDLHPATALQYGNELLNIIESQEKNSLIKVSLKDEDGLENLKKMLLNIIDIPNQFYLESDAIFVSNIRHIEKLLTAQQALKHVMETIYNQLPLDFWVIDLRQAVIALGEITGEDITDEVINNIFVNFCIGK